MDEAIAFRIAQNDNVATALCPIEPGTVRLTGADGLPAVQALESIPMGHKLALRDIAANEPIVKYGVTIGQATQPITTGSWVHLHCMKSNYDERSIHLDPVTGAPQDIRYE